jgi:hypothetical protein
MLEAGIPIFWRSSKNWSREWFVYVTTKIDFLASYKTLAIRAPRNDFPVPEKNV